MSNDDKVILPEVMVYAGPNGSGKSTITKMAKTVGVYINADLPRLKRYIIRRLKGV